jgi:hypothetical protein
LRSLHKASKINKVNKISVQAVCHTTQKTQTLKSHLHSFPIFSIIGSTVACRSSIIKSIGGRLFLFRNSHDFNINCFFFVGARNCLDGRILGHLSFPQHAIRESNNKVRITESKQKLKISKYIFLFSTNNRQHIVVTKRASPLLQNCLRGPSHVGSNKENIHATLSSSVWYNIKIN